MIFQETVIRCDYAKCDARLSTYRDPGRVERDIGRLIGDNGWGEHQWSNRVYCPEHKTGAKAT